MNINNFHGKRNKKFPNVTTQKVSHDSETPAESQQVFSVAAFIHHEFSDGIKLFMPRRAATKKFLPNIFELPGGHVDFGEQMVDGLIREVKEEFAMSITVGEPFAVFTYMNEIKGSHSIEVIYFAQFSDPLEKIHFNHEDHSEYIWVAEHEFDKAMDGNKNADDPEIKAIKRGFELLSGAQLSFS